MKLSTKARYAVMAMVDLAQAAAHKQPVTLTEIAARQFLPLSYLEQLFMKLRKAGLVQSVRGQSGGYHLGRGVETITIAEIIQAVGEEMRATGCKAHSKMSCQGQQKRCLTHDLWSGLGQVMENYLRGITLHDVIQNAEEREKSHLTISLSRDDHHVGALG